MYLYNTARNLVSRTLSNEASEQKKAQEKKEQAEIRLKAVKSLDERVEAYRILYPHCEGDPEQIKRREKIFKKWEAAQKLPGIEDDDALKPFLARITSFIRGVTTLESTEIEQLPMALIFQTLKPEDRKNLALTSKKVRDNVYGLTSEDFKKYEKQPELLNDVPFEILFNCLQSLALKTTLFYIPRGVQKAIANACLRKCLEHSSFDFQIFKTILKADIADEILFDATRTKGHKGELDAKEWLELVAILKGLKRVRKFELVEFPAYCYSLKIIPLRTRVLILRDCKLYKTEFVEHIKNLRHVQKLELSNITWEEVRGSKAPLVLPANVRELKLDHQALRVIRWDHCSKLKKIELGVFSLSTRFTGFPPSVEEIRFCPAKTCRSPVKVSDQFIKNHIVTLPSLQTLIFENNQNCDIRGETLSQLPETLTTLQIEPTHTFSQEGFVQYLSRQKSIKLKVTDKIAGKGVDFAAVLEQLPKDTIESAALVNTKGHFKVLLALTKQTNLKHLTIGKSFERYSGKIFNVLPTSLESLEINSSDLVEYSDTKFERFFNLKTFKCDGFAAFKFLAKLPGSVKHISFNYASDEALFISRAVLENIQEKLQSLELESFTYHGLIHDSERTLTEGECQVLEKIIESLPTSLKVFALPKLSPRAFESALSTLQPLGLTSLEFFLPYFGKEGGRSMALPPSLVSLKVMGCENLKDLLTVVDLKSLPSLKRVEVKFFGRNKWVKYEVKDNQLVPFTS